MATAQTTEFFRLPPPFKNHSQDNYVVRHFRAEAIVAHIELQKGERSELAGFATNIL